jgi:hypothetical protein
MQNQRWSAMVDSHVSSCFCLGSAGLYEILEAIGQDQATVRGGCRIGAPARVQRERFGMKRFLSHASGLLMIGMSEKDRCHAD